MSESSFPYYEQLARERGDRYALQAAADALDKLRASSSETRPTLPKAPGVGRDGPHAPKGTVMVFFERDLTDDELRNFHDWINGRYPSAPDALLDSDAPRGNRTRGRT